MVGAPLDEPLVEQVFDLHVLDIFLIFFAYWGIMGALPRRIDMGGAFADSTAEVLIQWRKTLHDFVFLPVPLPSDGSQPSTTLKILRFFLRLNFFFPALFMSLPFVFVYAVVSALARSSVTISALGAATLALCTAGFFHTTNELAKPDAGPYDEHNLWPLRVVMIAIAGLGIGDSFMLCFKIAFRLQR